MRYDDAARRYNFLAGLGLGAVLGVGLAMLAIPQKKVLTQRSREARRAIDRRWSRKPAATRRPRGTAAATA